MSSDHRSNAPLVGTIAFSAGGWPAIAIICDHAGKLWPYIPTLPLLHDCDAIVCTTVAASLTSVGSPKPMHPSLWPVPRMFTAAYAKPASSRKETSESSASWSVARPSAPTP